MPRRRNVRWCQTYAYSGESPRKVHEQNAQALPKNRHDDPSAAKAVLFFFIPFFNIYWHFFSYLRLMDRIDEQRQMAGLPPAANKGLFITASVLMFVPVANYVSILILMPVFFGTLQSNVNGLVAATYRAA